MMAVAVTLITAALALAFVRAFVFTLLWQWFLVPLGIPPIGVAHAMGLVVILSLLVHKPDLEDRSKDEALKRSVQLIVHHGLGVAVALLMGFVIRSFM